MNSALNVRCAVAGTERTVNTNRIFFCMCFKGVQQVLRVFCMCFIGVQRVKCRDKCILCALRCIGVQDRCGSSRLLCLQSQCKSMFNYIVNSIGSRLKMRNSSFVIIIIYYHL